MGVARPKISFATARIAGKGAIEVEAIGSRVLVALSVGEHELGRRARAS